jgi:RNA polymerase sigma-70 factor (ECF subfamily)
MLEKRRVVTGGSDLAYLLRALHNTFISTRRAAGSRPQLSSVDVELAPTAVATRGQPETAARVREIFAAISGLPDDFRAAIVAVDVAGLSYEEAAKALDVKQSTLATRIFRARGEMLEHFEERENQSKTGPRGLVGDGGKG